MARTLVDIDEKLLSEVSALPGTTTKRATVNGALREVAALHRRAQAVRSLCGMTFLERMADPGFEPSAWR